jgi:hypothetical protein
MGESRGGVHFGDDDICVFQVRPSAQDKDGKLTNQEEDSSSRLMPRLTRKVTSLVLLALMQMVALLPFIFSQQHASGGDITQQATLQMAFRILQLVEEHRQVTFPQAIILPEPAVIARKSVCHQVQRSTHKENQDPYPQRRDRRYERGLARLNNPKAFVDEYGNILTPQGTP